MCNHLVALCGFVWLLAPFDLEGRSIFTCVFTPEVENDLRFSGSLSRPIVRVMRLYRHLVRRQQDEELTAK